MAFRESGVRELAALLDHGEPGLVLTARSTLQRIAEEDHPRITAMAQVALDAGPGQAVQQLEAQARARWEAEEQARREAEAQARREAEQQAEREAQERAQREAQERAQREAQERARRETEAQAQREAERQAQREAQARVIPEAPDLSDDLDRTAEQAEQANRGDDASDTEHGQDVAAPAPTREHRRSRYHILAPAGAAIIVVALAIVLSQLGTSRSPGTGTAHRTSATSVAGVYGPVPQAASGAEYAGTISVAEPSGATPDWILPLTPITDNTPSNTSLFDYLMYRPLYWFVNGAKPEENNSLSLASDPVVSDGDTTFTIQLKSSYRWSNGEPITSRDVLFWYDELKAAINESAENWLGYMPGVGLPDEVKSVSTPTTSSIVFTMQSPVNPSWFLQNELSLIQPMPSFVWAKGSANGPPLDFTNPANAKKIYNFLVSQSKSETTWGSSQLWQTVDGPYKLSAFNEGAFTMMPNKKYGGPEVKDVSGYRSVPFPTDAAEYGDVQAGSLDIGYVPITDTPQISQLESNHGYIAYGEPSSGFNYIVYNFEDATGHFDQG
jgi:hypothetical protein